MGKVAHIDLFFSELEWNITRALNINVVEVCRQSIKDEIATRSEIRDIVTRTENIVNENARLRQENEVLREQIRNIPPSQEQRMKAVACFGYR